MLFAVLWLELGPFDLDHRLPARVGLGTPLPRHAQGQRAPPGRHGGGEVNLPRRRHPLRETALLHLQNVHLEPVAHDHVAGLLVGRAGPSHLAAIVMDILPPGRESLCEVTVIV